jgi:hypothetical protein
VNASFNYCYEINPNADISLPRISVTGEQLPTARYISSTIHRDLGFHDHAVTVFLPAFGQLIDHDMASGAETKGSFLFITPSSHCNAHTHTTPVGLMHSQTKKAIFIY